MACSHCGGEDHNIQTCPSVRRCSVCHKRGHDRRNCPHVPREPRPPAVQQAPPPPKAIPPADLYEQLPRLCASGDGLLAHLYWSENQHYFEDSRSAYLQGEGWLLKATPGHGVSHPERDRLKSRPTINFFVADEAWANAYAIAAEHRSIHHGILLDRTALEQLARRPGFEFAEVCPKHPNARGVVDPDEFWKFDVPSRRFGALHEMCHATVARLATPAPPRPDSKRRIVLPNEAIVACW